MKRVTRRKTKGYKVFVRGSKKRWRGHYFDRPKDWVLKKGAILKAKVGGSVDWECGPGVHFWKELSEAALYCYCNLPLYGEKYIIWEVEVPKGTTVITARYWNKIRADQVVLVRKVPLEEVQEVQEASAEYDHKRGY